jgi:hypothetical protein
VTIRRPRCAPNAYDLLAWFRLLEALEVDWTRATRWEVRDFVRWYRLRGNQQRRRGRADPVRPPAWRDGA